MNNPDNRSSWDDEDSYWRKNYRSRPYATSAGQEYDHYAPGYRYGYEAANRFKDRSWDDVETDLSGGWNSYEHRGSSTWEQMKHAVRDAWDRVTGKHHAGAP
jgi:hypothetical protein